MIIEIKEMHDKARHIAPTIIILHLLKLKDPSFLALF